MKTHSVDKFGAVAIITGSLLFALYSLMFPILLPAKTGGFDMVDVVLNPNWRWLAVISFAGILFMMAGFYGAYGRIRESGGIMGAAGFLFIEAAYLLQACKVTWELIFYPIIASHPESAFLLRDAVIKHDFAMVIFRSVASGVIFIGIVLFCWTLYRSEQFPKSASTLIFTGALIYAIGPVATVYVSVLGIFILAVGCLQLGARLLKPQY